MKKSFVAGMAESVWASRRRDRDGGVEGVVDDRRRCALHGEIGEKNWDAEMGMGNG